MLAGAVAGLVAGMLTLGTATALAAVLSRLAMAGGQPSPIPAVADAFIERTPAWLKDFAIATFGTADKIVLGVGIVVVLVAACAGIGVLARRNTRAALLTFVLLGAVGSLAVATRAGSVFLDVLPTVAGTVLGLWWLQRSAGPTVGPAGVVGGTERGQAAVAGGIERGQVTGAGGAGRAHIAEAGGIERRQVVGAGAGLAVGAAGLALSRAGAAAESARGTVALPTPTARAVVPAGAQLDVPGISPWVVPNAQFYRIDTAFVVPRIDPATWRLRVTGMVEREVELDWATLLAKPMHEAVVTLTCVSNEVGGDLVGNAVWTGWPVRELLAQAGPLPGADMVLQTSHDGWTCSTPIEALTDDREALLAVAMNGEPLPFEHGYPVRLVVPGLYGYVSATKWVTELKVTRFEDDLAYWSVRGWSERGPVKTSSRIDVPRTGARVEPGRVAVAGVAWAQHNGIEKVEVRVDDGPWQTARLADEPTVDAWRQWVFEWDASAGSHTLTVRATDRAGTVQTDAVAPPAPDGATGLHSITVSVG